MAAMTKERLEDIERAFVCGEPTDELVYELLYAARDSIRYREALEKLHDSVTVTDAIAVNALWVAQQCKNVLESK